MADDRNPYIAPKAPYLESSEGSFEDNECLRDDLCAESGRLARWIVISLSVSSLAAILFTTFGVTLLLTSDRARFRLDGAFALFNGCCLAVLVLQLSGTRRAIKLFRCERSIVTLAGFFERIRNVFITVTVLSAALVLLGVLYLFGDMFQLAWRI